MIEDGYRGALGWSIRHRVRTTLIVAVVFVAGLYLFGFVGGEFFPESDNGYLQVILNLPAGTTLDQTHRLLQEVEEIVRREVPETESILLTVGADNPRQIATPAARATAAAALPYISRAASSRRAGSIKPSLPASRVPSQRPPRTRSMPTRTKNSIIITPSHT